MKKFSILILCFITNILCLHAQNIFPASGSAGIGTITPDASSILEMVSTTKGMLVPRMSKVQRDAIIKPATGLLIYQTNSTPGFYYYNGSSWQAVIQKFKGWSLTGNAGTIAGTNFIGTTDAQPLVFKVNNAKAGYLNYSNNNTGFGILTLNSNIGSANTAIGYSALSYNDKGDGNTAAGAYSLYRNINGTGNTATGVFALSANTYGNNNTAMGFDALYANTTGFSNIAIGSYSLFRNTVGHNLVAIGDSALYNQNENFGFSTAVGSKALYSSTTGYENTASGANALFFNTAGWDNTATGNAALYHNDSGINNTASGHGSLFSNVSGDANTASGGNALSFNINGYYNTATGYSALFHNTDGFANTAIGTLTDVNDGNYSNSTAIGYSSLITSSNQVRIGNSNITSIGGYVNWSNISDGRVKKNIKANVPGLSFINKLEPVTYNLNLDAIDNIAQRQVMKDENGKAIALSQQETVSKKLKEQIVYTGFVAQDVEKAAKSLQYDFSGVDVAKNDKDLYGLRYSDFVVPLVKAVQELSKQNDDLKKQNDDTRKEVEELKKIVLSLQSKTISVDATDVTTIQPVAPGGIAKLEQNIPNPFISSTAINYYLPVNNGNAYLNIYSSAGNLLKSVHLTGTGKGALQLKATDLPSGSYRYALFIDRKMIESRQMTEAK